MNSSLKRIFIGIILPILLIAGGIVTVVFSAKTLGKYKTYSETEAVIDRIDADYSGEDVEYHVFVKYTVDGKDYRGELGSYNASFKEGATIGIMYDPADPAEILYKSVGMTVLAIVIGGLVSVVGAGMIVKTVVKGIY